MTFKYLHSVFNSFPVAMLIALVAIEAIILFRGASGLKSAAEVLMIFLLIGTVLSFITGYQAQHSASQSFEVPDERIAAHLNLGRLLLFSVIATVSLGYFRFRAIRAQRVWQVIYILSLLISAVLLYLTASRGGELVYRFGAGVVIDRF